MQIVIKYIAVSTAEISSTHMPAISKGVPISRAASERYHLLKNPLKGGIPVSARADMVKAVKVSGIYRPIPSSEETFCFPVYWSTAPAAKKAAILIPSEAEKRSYPYW